MHHAQRSLRRLWLAVLMISAAACQPVGGPQVGSAVFVVDVDQLAAPQIAAAEVYRPTFQFAPDPRTPAALSSAFFLTVASSHPQLVNLRIRRGPGQTAVALQRLSPPSNPRTLQADDTSWTIEPALQAVLSAGNGAFWQVPEDSTSLERRFAVIVPNVLAAPLATLEIFEGRDPLGVALWADRIDLAYDFFYLAAIGDSAMWGNGLRTADKFVTRVADAIQNETHRRVIVQHLAVSGARLVADPADGQCVGFCQGEVPKAIPSVSAQADHIQEPQLMDLILMNGCANDVGLSTILSTAADSTDLVQRTRHFCGEELEQLIRKVRGLAPQAALVIPGYGLVVSTASDLSDLQGWISTLDTALVQTDDVSEFIGDLAANAAIFEGESKSAIMTAIDAVVESTGDDAIAFADPGYGPQNATFGPAAWLWGLTDVSDITLTLDLALGFRLFPEDPLLDERLDACAQPGVFPDLLSCVYSSVAHPNRAGALAYTRAIVSALRDLGMLEPQAADAR